MKHKSVLVFLIIVTVTFSVQHTYASTAADLDYGIMIENADFIIVGNVTRIHNNTYTYVTIAIKEFVTNPQNISQITITIGGELQGAGELSRDSFEVGERVFVFVEKIGPYHRVLYGEAGKYTVVDEKPPYIHSSQGIISGWNTAPGWNPRIVVHSDADPIGHGTTNLFPFYLAQILFAVLLIPFLFVFMKRRKKKDQRRE